MTISLKTQKMLWGRSASRCSVCRMELVTDGSLTDDESLVGECCHIVAKEPEGPRGESTLTAEQRDKYANLILLCNVHHKQIDDQVNAFPVDRLTRIKEEHEQWVRDFGRDCPPADHHAARSCQAKLKWSWNKWEGPASSREGTVYAAKAA